MKRIIFSKKFITVFALAVLASGFGLYIWQQEHRPALLEIYTFGLKTGNSSFIRTPDDQRVLINGGGNSEVIRHISKILPFYSRRIDMVMATDIEKKNIAGLVGVLERYSVEQLILPAVTLKSLDLASTTDPSYTELLKVARKKKVSIREVVEGERLVIGEDDSNNKITLDILFPAKAENFDYSKASAPEINFNLSFGENNILWLGESSKKIQKYVAMNSSSTKPLDVLIVSHNASPDNISLEFLEKFQPGFLVYSQSPGRSSATNIVPFERRFNVKEKTVKIGSDGRSIDISR